MLEISTQLAVIGGGPAGVCAALAAARLGIETVLITNRPVLGGNSSSEIRVWTRGATGAGNLYAEEMGVWGLLKLENLYRNLDANPIFWDDVLLDAVFRQDHLTIYFNSEVFEVSKTDDRIDYLEGIQQGTENHLKIKAGCYIDATGDGSISARADVPFVVGSEMPGETDRGFRRGTLGSSILYFTRKEAHPVSFVPPSYAYPMDEIEKIVGHGGRIVNERMSGSDCWWFEYGGLLDTIKDAQDIAFELRRLVMGVWNYIKNSGRFSAEHYTLEWVGSLPGKRESRRMQSEYFLTKEDILSQKEFTDGALYGGWYIDSHPEGGIHDLAEESCIQIPVNVYQIPLRCLYHRNTSNLIFAGRIIGVERDVFFSSRIMNTCALSGQAAGTLAGVCLKKGKAPYELAQKDIDTVLELLQKEDMFIPGKPLIEADRKEVLTNVTASSFHDGKAGDIKEKLELCEKVFIAFPGVGGNTLRIKVRAHEKKTLVAHCYSAMLPNKLNPGDEEGTLCWDLKPGEQTITAVIPEHLNGRFCIWVFDPVPGISLLTTCRKRIGFVSGYIDNPEISEPIADYERPIELYTPGQIISAQIRPWGTPNVWLASEGDQNPWIKLEWNMAQTIKEIRLYLDPDLSMELPSSRAKSWAESHLFSARSAMPPQLLKSFSVEAELESGEIITVYSVDENYKRLVEIPLNEPRKIRSVCLKTNELWGQSIAAVYGIRVW